MTGMEIIGVVNLAVDFLDRHVDGIVYFADNAMGLADRAVGAMERRAANAEVQSEALIAIARSQDQLKRAIKQSTEILATLIKSESLAIIEKMERDRARNAIDDLKAAVTAMKAILAETNTSKALKEQFVTQHLMPVRHYMIKASNILEESEDKNLGSCCRIVGLTALVAGYEHMGQNVESGVKKELKEELLALQKRLLTNYAREVLVDGGEFPWDDVPKMLQPHGALELAKTSAVLSIWAKHTSNTPSSQPNKRLLIIAAYKILFRYRWYDSEEDDDALSLVKCAEFGKDDNLGLDMPVRVPDPASLAASEARICAMKIPNLTTLAWFILKEKVSNKGTKRLGGRETVLKVCREQWQSLTKDL